MTIWRLISFHEEASKQRTAQNFIDNQCIAIGWGNIGDLNQYDSKASIGEAIREHYDNAPNANIGGPRTYGICAIR